MRIPKSDQTKTSTSIVSRSSPVVLCRVASCQYNIFNVIIYLSPLPNVHSTRYHASNSTSEAALQTDPGVPDQHFAFFAFLRPSVLPAHSWPTTDACMHNTPTLRFERLTKYPCGKSVRAHCTLTAHCGRQAQICPLVSMATDSPLPACLPSESEAKSHESQPQKVGRKFGLWTTLGRHW